MRVEVLTPGRPVATVKAHGVSLPGTLGYMGILPGHASLVSELDAGELHIDKVDGGENLHYFLSGGYVEVHADKVTVLADVIESHSQIDVKRAEAARDRALGRLAGNAGGPVDADRAQNALKRAEARLLFCKVLASVAHGH